MPRALLLTGTCGSGKSTVARILAERHGWSRFSEDDVWRERFHRKRGAPGTADHLRKRGVVRAALFARIGQALAGGHDVVVDATVHEGSVESFGEYQTFFDRQGVHLSLRVLHPGLEVAIRRDAQRPDWSAGAAGVAALWRKYTGERFARAAFLDTSRDTPEESARRVLSSLAPGGRNLRTE